VTVLMITIAIVLFGFVSLARLKLNLLPDLSYPTLTVRTDLPGAAPVELETLVTRPIEEAVGVIRNVKQVQSVSRAGQSDVILEFVWGTDMDLAGIDVREKLDVLQLPLEADRPLLLRFDPSTEPVMRLAFRDEAGEAADPVARVERLKSLRRFADDRLKPALESVPGSAAIKVSGGYEDEIQVLVDQRKLAQLGLSIETVSRRLREENINLSGGRLEQGTQRFLVRTLNEFTSVPQMADAILANVGGRPVYLRDVAEVRQGYREREAITRVDGAESVELAVYKEGDANTVQLAHALVAEIDKLGKSLPPGSRLDIVYDQSRFIDSAISEVRDAAILGGLLAILVLYLFLRDARATLITGVAIPVSVIGTFLLMYAFDLSLNIMSLGGIALAVGMLVDNAVVVLESIVRHREAGASRPEAARRGTVEVGTAVTAATLTSVAVFFPMVFISGVAGQLFRDQALTVTFALLFSLVVALTLVPMLAAGRAEAAPPADVPPQAAPGRVDRGLAALVRVLRRGASLLSTLLARLFSPAAQATQLGYRAIERGYLPALRWSLAHRGRVVTMAVAVLLATAALVPRLGSELIPQLSQGEFLVDIRLPPGSTLEQTDRVMAAAQGMAMELPGVRRVYAVTGTGNRLDANPTDAGDNTGRLTVLLAPGADRADERAAIAGLRDRLDALAGVQYQFSRPALFSFDTPLEVVVAGYDLDRLRGVAAEVRRAIEASDRFSDVKSTVEAGNPEIQIVFDQQRAAQLGLTVRELADRVVSSVRGDVATRYKLRERNIDVLVRSVDTRSASIEEIRNLIVNPGSERPVTLEAVADVRVATGPAEVRRLKQERVAVISANLARGDLGSAVAELERIVAGIELPVETTISVSGQSADMRESFVSLQLALLMAVFLVYLVMASQFESLLHPFVILLTIPLALVGSVWAMFVTGTTVNVVAYIGLIMLAGIVVNQSIVLIDAVNQARERGADKHAAIVEAGRTRLRPILITKLTTILGLMPMALGIGDGAEIRQPMAVTVIGGVAVASVFTLLVIPVVYSLLDRKRFAPAALDARLDGAAEA
jgi:HAE1 family hydrophobic/amphiphilic exporter-1